MDNTRCTIIVRRSIKMRHMLPFSENEILTSYLRAWNRVSNNVKVIKISLVEPEICWFEVIHNKNREIKKITLITCSRKSLTMYSHIEASVQTFCFWKIRSWAETWRRVWGGRKNFWMTFLGKNFHFYDENFWWRIFSHRPCLSSVLCLSEIWYI